MKELTLEQKMDSLSITLKNYASGFITKIELITQIIDIPWNKIERKAVESALNDSILELNDSTIQRLLF